MPEWFEHVLRVRYSETDNMGVVYHANYLSWFEMGRTEAVRTMGISYKGLEERGLLLPVLSAEVDFVAPARYDDTVAVHTRICGFTGLRMEFEYEVRLAGAEAEGSASQGKAEHGQRGGKLLARGKTRHAWLSRDWRPVRLDREAPEVFAVLQNYRAQYLASKEE